MLAEDSFMIQLKEKDMLSLDRRRAFGLWFWVAIAAHLALYFNDVSFFVLESNGDALMTFSLSRSMGMLTYVAPFFSALPFAAGFCTDWINGFASSAAMRSGNRRYLLSKIRACALSGGLVPAIATLIFIVFLNFRFPTDPELMVSFVDGDPFNRVLLMGSPVGLGFYYLGVTLMQFMAGACWALTGLAFSAFVPNVLLTMCIPLAAYRLSLELYYWFELPCWLNLPLLQDCTAELNYILTLLAGFTVFGAVCLILGAVFCIRTTRRLTYG